MSKLAVFIGGLNRFSLGVYQTESGVFSNFTSVELDADDVTEKKSLIQTLIANNSSLFDDVDEFIFGLDHPRNTLVPNELFSNASAKEILQFNFEELQDDPDYNRIPEHGMVNAFEFPLWLKSFLVIKFPQISLNHITTSRIKHVFNFPTFKEKTYVFRNATSIEIIRVKEGKLLFCNTFKVVTWEDIVYFVLLVLNKEAVSKDNEILLMDFLDSNEKEKLTEFISQEFGAISDQQDKYFSLKGLKLCV